MSDVGNADPETIIVHLRRSRLVLFGLACTPFFAFGLWTVLQPLAEMPLRVWLGGWVCLALALFIGIFILKRLLRRRPAVIITSEGITDNASPLSVGFIPWIDVTGARIVAFQKQKLLGLDVAQVDAYLSRVHWSKRWLMKGNRSRLGYPINIPQTILAMPVETLLAHIEAHCPNLRPI